MAAVHFRLVPKSSKRCAAYRLIWSDTYLRKQFIVLAIGEDRVEKHRVSLSRVATGHNALRGNNHAVPVLCELVHDDMIFAVFPLLSRGFNDPWFYRFSEVLDAVEQVLDSIL